MKIKDLIPQLFRGKDGQALSLSIYMICKRSMKNEGAKDQGD